MADAFQPDRRLALSLGSDDASAVPRNQLVRMAPPLPPVQLTGLLTKNKRIDMEGGERYNTGTEYKLYQMRYRAPGAR